MNDPIRTTPHVSKTIKKVDNLRTSKFLTVINGSMKCSDEEEVIGSSWEIGWSWCSNIH